MTPEEAIEELSALAGELHPDIEANHLQADDILCQLLIALGYSEVVRMWRRVPKWYA